MPSVWVSIKQGKQTAFKQINSAAFIIYHYIKD